MAGSCGESIFSFSEDHPQYFPLVTFLQQCLRVPSCLHPPQHSLFFVFLVTGILTVVRSYRCNLNFISKVCWSFVLHLPRTNCLLVSLACLLIDWVVLYPVIQIFFFSFFVYSRYYSILRQMNNQSRFSPILQAVCSLSFPLLCTSFLFHEVTFVNYCH